MTATNKYYPLKNEQYDEENEVKKLLELILEQSGMLKGLSKDEKNSLIEQTCKNLADNEVTLTRDNILKPDSPLPAMLLLALEATFVQQQKPELKFKFNFKLLFADPYDTNPEEKKEQESQFDDLKSIEKTPELKEKIGSVVITDDAGNFLGYSSESAAGKSAGDRAISESESISNDFDPIKEFIDKVSEAIGEDPELRISMTLAPPRPGSIG